MGSGEGVSPWSAGFAPISNYVDSIKKHTVLELVKRMSDHELIVIRRRCRAQRRQNHEILTPRVRDGEQLSHGAEAFILTAISATEFRRRR